jgi:hypothetical protein
MAEVRRLEDMRYQQMVELVLTKGEELSSMCKGALACTNGGPETPRSPHTNGPAVTQRPVCSLSAAPKNTESHVEEPAGLQAALAAIHGEDRNPGAAAELLAKLLHMLAEVQVHLSVGLVWTVLLLQELEGGLAEAVS